MVTVWVAIARAAEVDAAFDGIPALGVTRCRGDTVPDVAWVRHVPISGVAPARPEAVKVALYVDGVRTHLEIEGTTLAVQTRDLVRHPLDARKVERVEQEARIRRLDGGEIVPGFVQFDLRWTCETTHYPPVPSGN